MTRLRARLKPVLQLLTAACVLTAGHAARAAEISPYFHTWDGSSLMDSRQNSGLNSAILAFGITHGTCVLDPILPAMTPDARNFMAAGGKLLISFGGTGGTYLQR
jgi:chitinase